MGRLAETSRRSAQLAHQFAEMVAVGEEQRVEGGRRAEQPAIFLGRCFRN